MATGATAIPIAPGSRKTGAKVRAGAEASAQTHPKGTPIIRSAGFMQSVATGVVTALHGFAVSSGRNGASDGAKKNTVYVAQERKEFKGVLAGTFTNAHRGSAAVISVNTAGSAVLSIGTAVSASYASGVVIQDAAPGWKVGDVNAVVLFTVVAAGIQN